ncbi:MAG: ComEC/Rec2 family competence protein, partial [Zoogloea sp.]
MGQLASALPSGAAQLAGAATACAAGGLAWGASRRSGRAMMWWRRILVFLAALLAGWSFAAWRADLRLADALPAEWEGRDVVLRGVVASLPQDFERGVRFNFQVEGSAAPVPAMISLAWYRGFRDEEMHVLPPIHAGERWSLTVRLKRPHGNLNPHGFDYEGWLLQQDIRATGYVRPAEGNRLMDARVPGLAHGVERVRETVRQRFRDALPDAPYTGVLVALAVGDQRSIPPALWKTFARTGISHLVAISGMHVTMVAAFFAAL